MNTKADNIPKALEILSLIVLSMVFFFSGITKFMDPSQFVLETYYYRILPIGTLHILCAVLIMLELLVAFSIWVPRFRAASAFIISALMLMFIVFIGSAMARGLDISCGCFGAHSQQVGWSKIGENTVLLLCSLAVFIKNYPIKK